MLSVYHEKKPAAIQGGFVSLADVPCGTLGKVGCEGTVGTAMHHSYAANQGDDTAEPELR